jgi:hypothetical protein
MSRQVPTVRLLAALLVYLSMPSDAYAICNPPSVDSQDHGCPSGGNPDTAERHPDQQTGNGYRAPFNGFNGSYQGNTDAFSHGGTQPPGGAYGYQGRNFGGGIGHSR